MPQIRRSSRIQTLKNSSHVRNSSPPKGSSDNITDKSSKDNCVACKQKHPPIRRYSTVEWTQCDHCDSWWHAECACLTAEDCSKLSLHNISYTCALCVLKGSPWVVDNHKLGALDAVDPEHQTATSSASSEVIDKVQVDLVSSNNTTENIIVVDNIENSQHLKSSNTIREKLENHPVLRQIEFAYSLPRGGVALHCKSKEEADNILSHWPDKVFAEREKPHRIQPHTPCKTGFLKNIDVKIRDSEVKGFLESQQCKVQEVRRVFHRNSGKPMPIRKVTFVNNSDLKKSKQLDYPFKLHGRKAFCEEERKHKVVRCFACHRFNHIAVNCPHKPTCENCGTDTHSNSTDCQLPSKCINCGGKHRSSSNQCPSFQDIIQRYRKNQIF